MQRNVRGPAKDRDIAAQRFLEALIWLRAVLCQDIALLQIEYPEHPVCANHLFSGRAWKQFQKDVLAACTEERANPFRLTSLPPDVSGLSNLRRSVAHFVRLCKDLLVLAVQPPKQALGFSVEKAWAHFSASSIL